MLMPFLIIFLWILVILAVAYGAFYIIGQMSLPTPQMVMIVRIIVGVILLIVLLGLLISGAPGTGALFR